MQEQFERLGLPAERVPAVTPDEVPKDMLRFCDDRRDQWLSPVELACAMSHRKTWELIAKRGLPNALIFEDDAILAASVSQALDRLADALATLDIVKVEASVLPLLIEPDSVGWLRKVFSYRYGAAGYAISGEGAKKLLKHAVHDIPVDDLLFSPDSPMARRLVMRQTVPALCITLDRQHDLDAAPEQAASSIGASGGDRAALLYKARHTPSLRMLRYAISRARGDIRKIFRRSLGDARWAVFQTIPVENAEE